MRIAKGEMVEFSPLPCCDICFWVTSGTCKHPKPVKQDNKCLGFDWNGLVSDFMSPDKHATEVYKGKNRVWRQKAKMHDIRR